MTMSYHLLNKSYKTSNLILTAGIIILAIFIALKIPTVSDIILKIYYQAIYSQKGGQFEALTLLTIIPIFVITWLWLLFIKKDYLKALSLQIMAFPFTYKAKSAFAVLAYDPGFGSTPQKISVTTFLIIALFCILSFQRVIKRPKNREWRVFEKGLLIYAISLTVTQFFNHSFHSAVWLSIGGIWQFVFLFYILSSVIKSYDDITLLLNGLICFTFLNILMRYFSEEQALFQQLGSDIIRVGAGAMGPAVSYGGYLAIMITITIALYRIKNNKLYLAITLFFFAELLNTFTRGAFLILFILLIIPAWKSERKFFSKTALILFPGLLIFGPKIWEYASYRGLSFAAKKVVISSVTNRYNLITNYFQDNFDFSFIGNGIGNLTPIWNGYRFYPAHNITIALIDQVGIIVTIVFLFIFAHSFLIAFKKSKYDSFTNTKKSELSLFVLIALIQWVVFANTTSTLLNWYYPYEASAIFWIILFLPCIISCQTKDIMFYKKSDKFAERTYAKS